MFLILFITFVASAYGLEVNFTGEWLVGTGTVLSCSWSFPDFDRLQSVKLYHRNQQLAAFRPEFHGSEVRMMSRGDGDSVFEVFCNQRNMASFGDCIVSSRLDRIPPEDVTTYVCEVSGERPKFRIVRKNFLLAPFVASSGAQLETTEDMARGSVAVNCSATGLPAPELSWSAGDRQITGDFTGRFWNETTKIWHSWSLITWTPNDEELLIQCTPRQGRPNEVEAPSASYTLKRVNNRGTKGITSIALVIFTTICVLR